MRLRLFLASLCLSVCSFASETDSVRVERMLCEASSLPADSCRTLHFAKQLLGVPYVANTLDVNEEEHLVVHLDRFDCTTFVETVVALTLADKQGERTFQTFKEKLAKLRYRQGKMEGYASRLHYFSDWIQDNERKGMVKEVTSLSVHARKEWFSLNFMSTHADSYPMLKGNSCLLKEIAEMESRWQHVAVHYLPKKKLHLSQGELGIHNGDILAITTSIPGLDVVHVGFACWIGGKLHLLHASSLAKRVIIDHQTLFEYSRNKKAHTGVRAVRVMK